MAESEPLSGAWIRRAEVTVDATFSAKEYCNALECEAAKCHRRASWVIGGKRRERPVSKILCAIHAKRYCGRPDVAVGIPKELKEELLRAIEAEKAEQALIPEP